MPYLSPRVMPISIFSDISGILVTIGKTLYTSIFIYILYTSICTIYLYLYIYIYMHIYTIYLLLRHDFYTTYLFYGCRPCFGVFQATIFSPPGWRQLKNNGDAAARKVGEFTEPWAEAHGIPTAGPGWDWVINLFPRKMWKV